MKKQEKEEALLKKAAKAIGNVAGTVAAAVTRTGPKAATPARSGKLPKKDKTRLPRKEKKAKQKADAAAAVRS